MLGPVLLPLLAALCLRVVPAVQAACSAQVAGNGTTSSTFWMADPNLHALGTSPFNSNSSYKVFRNVKDYGAVGDGVADDTAAINKAISDGGRCGQGCASSTVSPGLVYFPPGTYRVTTPIIPYYFTSLVGDFNNRPTLKADPSFTGMAVIDADPYLAGGANWWTNQNNFFRSIRNFIIDVSAMPTSAQGTGIHWQVGQATSLINIDFHMSSANGTQHQGIFGENGSGGFMSDLTFVGGKFGMWISNQQFTLRNIKISNAVTAIFENWNWGFTWQNVQITNCSVGWFITTGGTASAQAVGSVLILDSSISNTGIGIQLATSQPSSLAGSVILDNVAFSGITTANIQDPSGAILAKSSGTVSQWIQGNVYTAASGKSYLRGAPSSVPAKPSSLLSGGKVFTKSRPQYNTYTSGQFLSVKRLGGAKGDGVTDDTAALNNFIAANAGCGIIFFDAGTYVVKNTIFIPAGTIVVGEMFTTILGSGSTFSSQSSPTPVIRVGNPGDKGNVEISDMVFSTVGGSQGAIVVEWNVAATSQGSAGMWDVHLRLGGAKGTNMEVGTCPTSSTNVGQCSSSFLGLHITSTGSGYFENVWVWNADHDLDDPGQGQINAFSGRGILVESTSATWLFGTASEHHVIYEYAFHNAQNLFVGLIQTEVPYFQPSPAPPSPFSTNTQYGDPSGVTTSNAYGLTISNSNNILVYGAGLYSFFQDYNNACANTRNCQKDMALIDSASTNVFIYQLSTVGSTNMLTQSPSTALILQSDNVDGFASTASAWRSN